MESHLLDWASLLLRWLHVITAMAWLGSTFYFVFLEARLVPPADEALRQQGASGEMWVVHNRGFYRQLKVGPGMAQPSAPWHWFYWESYATWLSGFALLTVSYFWNARANLVDATRMDWPAWAAVSLALAFLVAFWLAYDAICRVVVERADGKGRDGMATALVMGLVVASAWLACQWFAGRAAFLLVGAAMATAMSANLAHWIVPGQRKTLAAVRAGQPVDAMWALRARVRSVHNTYFVLPVLFAMLSPHYAVTWNHPHNWVVLVLMMAAGVFIRQFYILRLGWQMGRNRHPLPYALAAGAVFVATAVWLAP